MTTLPTIIAELEEAERADQNSFLVIHEGDGRHATVCFTHEQAADAAILGMWAGSVQSAIAEDEYLQEMHAEIADPKSDQWEDGDGKRIHYDFEDGSLLIIRIPASVTHLPTLIEAVKRQGEALELVQQNVEASASSYQERVETIGRIARAALKEKSDV